VTQLNAKWTLTAIQTATRSLLPISI